MTMHDFTQLTDLAAGRLGGRAIAASDEFFAAKENLLRPGRGVFDPDRYTEQGKWMDGWESRRRRTPGHDWCVVRLAGPGQILGVNVDTNHFRGNAPTACSVDACRATEVDETRETSLLHDDARWTTLLPRTPIEAHATNLLPVDDGTTYTHVRLNIYPDGGVARFRVHGEPQPDWTALGRNGRLVDLAAAPNGGLAIGASDEFFSVPSNLLLPDRALHMGDGWETRRRRGPGHDWCVLKLGCRGVLSSIEVDTAFFKGNFPERCSLEAATLDHAMPRDLTDAAIAWRPVLPETRLRGDSVHRFEVANPFPCTHVRFNIFPDGGVSRLRLYGRPADAEPAS